MKILKPCPFCGSECEVNELFPNNAGSRFAVACRECHAVGPWHDNADAVAESWNARATETRQLTAFSAFRAVDRLAVR